MRKNANAGGVVRILSYALGIVLFLASTCFSQNPNFVYVANVNSSNVSGFAIDPATGSLASVPGSPVQLIDFATGVAISPSNSFLYASASIDIEIFSIDPVAGHLTGQGVPVFQGFGVGPLVFHPSGNFAYSTDNPISGGIGAIYSYSVDKSSGTLTRIGSPLATGAQPQVVAITPNGRFLYVANRFSSDISAYAIDNASGILTEVAGSRFGVGILPHDLTVDTTGQFLYVASGESSTLAGYNIDATTGAITQITGSPFLGGNRGPGSIAVEPTGRFAYAGNGDGTLSAFSRAANGVLVPLPNSPFPTTSVPHSTSNISIAVDSLGKFLYAADFTTSTVFEFQIDPINGSLTQLVSSPIKTGGSNPVSIAISRAPSISANIFISFVRPSQGGDTGLVTTTLTGVGFEDGATITLRRAGEADIVANSVEVSGAGTTCVGTFDLRGKTHGAWDVVVTNPDGTLATLAGAFTVVAGTGPQMWIDILGPPIVRLGRAETYYVLIGNSGNVDGSSGLVSLSIPSTLQYTQSSGPELFAAGSTSSAEFGIPKPSATSDQSLLFVTAGVPAGGTQFAPVDLTDVQLSQFTLRVSLQQYVSPFDAYLDTVQLPFIINGSCTGCSDSASALTNAHTSAEAAYNNWGNASQNIETAYVQAMIAVGGSYATGLIVERAGFQAFGGFLLRALLTEEQNCMRKFLDDPTLQSCYNDVKTHLGIVGNGVSTYLQQTLSADTRALLTKYLGLITNAITAISAVNDIVVAYQADNLAVVNFLNALDKYKTAWKVYQVCGCGPVTPPPVLIPGTESLIVAGFASYDPNDKFGNRGVGAQQYTSGTTPLSYGIYFSNKDTATAPAQKVSITDQLDINSDNLGVFSLGPIIFGGQLISPPPLATDFTDTVDLRPASNLLVAVHGHLDASNGLATWSFQSLDPSTNQPPVDPTAGFLPPGAEGNVFFSVAPKAGLATNTQISNQAAIVFDVNPPISTGTWLNTLDNTAPTSHVGALPATEFSAGFPVSWTGSDIGAGVQDFTIYVSDNGGPFAPFQTNSAATSATFTAQNSHTYGFYSIARDLVGNVEGAKTTAEATTVVSVDLVPPTTTAIVSPLPNAAGWNNSNVTVNLASMDNPGGSGVKQITYTATGAQTIVSTVVAGATTSFTITNEGTTTITFFGTDNAGNIEMARTVTINIDKTPPIVSCSTSPNILWPPNNKLVPVNVSVSVTDSLSGPAGFNLVSVTSSEPDSGNGDIQGFVPGTQSTTGQLRSQRLGSGTGRVYTFTYSGADNAGNKATCVTTVTVPHDQGH